MIRPGTPADLAAAARVYRRASLSNEGDRDNLLAHPEYLILGPEGLAEGRTHVAEEDGVLVGFATWAESGGIVELEDLFVDPGYRRRGIAMALVGRITEVVRAQGARHLEVTANPHALGFYRAAGFTDCGVTETELGPGHRMVLAISWPRRDTADHGGSQEPPVKLLLIRHFRDGWPMCRGNLGRYGQTGELSSRELDALFDQVPVPLVFADRDLRTRRTNAAFRQLAGLPDEALIGRRPSQTRMAGPVIDTGLIERTLAGSGRWSSLTDITGPVEAATALRQANARLDLLQRAASQIGTTLDICRTAEEFAALAVPELADLVSVDLLDSVLRGEDLLSAGPGAVRFRRVAVRHASSRACTRSWWCR